MSISQKHEGKVLVPWFNLREWESLYNYIYGEKRNWPRALEILQIWKLRTPLLSAGVEGTLIILEALLVDENKLTDFELTQIYSTSLMRFLNLCAANSDKQGSFYKTAMKNDLPNWMVTIRHEIAHSHKVPSKSMLKLSLQFCLNWLNEKYWSVQHSSMRDFHIPGNNLDIEDLVYVYADLSEQIYAPATYHKENKLNKRLYRLGLHKKDFSEKKMLELICKKISEKLSYNGSEVTERLADILLTNKYLFRDEAESDSNGGLQLQESSLKIWERFLNILHKHEFLQCFVTKLNEIAIDIHNNKSLSKLASFWLNEIYLGLNDANKETKNARLEFFSLSLSMKNKEFVLQLVDNPSPNSIYYIKSILTYNDAPDAYIEDILTLLKSLFGVEEGAKVDQRIFTVEDLNVKIDIVSNETNTVEKEVKTNAIEVQTRWTRILDTAAFENVPIGVLPSQSRQFNPVLQFN